MSLTPSEGTDAGSPAHSTRAHSLSPSLEHWDEAENASLPSNTGERNDDAYSKWWWIHNQMWTRDENSLPLSILYRINRQWSGFKTGSGLKKWLIVIKWQTGLSLLQNIQANLTDFILQLSNSRLQTTNFAVMLIDGTYTAEIYIGWFIVITIKTFITDLHLTATYYL